MCLCVRLPCHISAPLLPCKQEQNFDVLYVVDPHRSWYRGEAPVHSTLVQHGPPLPPACTARRV